MKTDQLVDFLARQAGPAPKWLAQRRLAVALLVGLAASVAAVWLTWDMQRPALNLAAALALKWAYVVGVLATATWAAYRLGRPGVKLGLALPGLGAVVLLMLAVATQATVQADSAHAWELLLGQSWTQCAWRVAALSLPAWVCTQWAMAGLAPTQPRWASAAAGLMGGASGALAYSIYCPELSPVFVVVWYSLGMLIPAAFGFVLGPRMMRW